MSRAYARGAAFERRVKALLEELGWKVIRSAGSHDEPDLVALRQGRVALLQCKMRSKDATPLVRAGLQDFARAAGATEAYIVRARGRRVEVRDVTLWDHEPWDPIEDAL